MLPRLLALVVLSTAAIATAGCTPPNREQRADAIQAAVETMPGVQSLRVSYINDFENGANITIDAMMPDATPRQIADAAAKIETLKGSDFADHRQKLTVAVGGRAVLTRDADADPEVLASDAAALRRLPAHDGYVNWTREAGVSRVEVWDTTDPDAVVRAGLTLLGPGDELWARSSAPETRNSWEVTMPLTDDQFDAARQIRDEVPVTPYELTIDEGRVSGASISLSVPPTPYPQLAGVVNILDPTPTHAVRVEWRLNGGGEIAEFTTCAALPVAGTDARDVAAVRLFVDSRKSSCEG